MLSQKLSSANQSLRNQPWLAKIISQGPLGNSPLTHIIHHQWPLPSVSQLWTVKHCRPSMLTLALLTNHKLIMINHYYCNPALPVINLPWSTMITPIIALKPKRFGTDLRFNGGGWMWWWPRSSWTQWMPAAIRCQWAQWPCGPALAKQWWPVVNGLGNSRLIPGVRNDW